MKAIVVRSLEGDRPDLWLDTAHVNLRNQGRIVSVAVIVAVAVNSDGRREVLGPEVDASEAERDVLAYMTFPKNRGTELHQSARSAQRRDQAPDRRRR